MSKRKSRATRSRLSAVDPATGVTIRELLAESERRQALTAVNADPLPGPLLLAFPAKPIRVGAFNVRPFVHADWATLRHLDSPLIKQLAELRKPKEQRQPTPFTNQDEWEMILVFLLGAEQAEQEVARDRQAFAATARRLIGHEMNPLIVEMLKGAVIEQFGICCSTAVEFAASSAPAAGEVFTKPPATPRMDLAGG